MLCLLKLLRLLYINSSTSLIDSPDIAIPSVVPATASDVLVELPLFSVMLPPAFLWNGTIKGPDFVECDNIAYDKVVHWKKKLFVVSFGREGRVCAGTNTFASLLRVKICFGMYHNESSYAFLHTVASEATCQCLL